jgi:hypothetical protein
MKLTCLVLITAILTASNFQAQDAKRFSYHAWGTVTDSDGQPMRDMYVCIVPAVRPINGRLSCVKTSLDGTFAITVKDIPDEYTVCASTKESPFILVPNHDPSHRVICSGKISFPAYDDCRKIDLNFDSKNRLDDLS